MYIFWNNNPAGHYSASYAVRKSTSEQAFNGSTDNAEDV